MIRLLAIGRITSAAAFASAWVMLAASSNQPTGSQGLFLVDKVGARLRFFNPKILEEWR